MSWYVQIITRWPHILLANILLLFGVCIAVALIVLPFPDLLNPIKGFEARGTPIAGREGVMHNIRNLSETDLTEEPPQHLPEMVLNHPAVSAMYKQFAAPLVTQMKSFPGGKVPSWRSIPPQDLKTIRGPGSERTESNQTRDSCHPGYVEVQPKIVFASTSGDSLLTPSALHSMCKIEKRLLPEPDCQARHSLTYNIEQLSGKTCEQVSQEDVDLFLEELRRCAPLYHGGQLNANCVNERSCNLLECGHPEAIYNTLHYLTDDQFFANTNNTQGIFNQNLKYALFSTPLHGLSNKDYYQKYILGGSLVFHHDRNLKEGDIYVKALDSLAKFELFEIYLLVDLFYFVVAMGFISLVMVLYLKSIAVTIATHLEVLFTLVFSYVLYHLVGIGHFPYLNIMTGLVVIAISADDVFLFFDTWQQIKAENPNGTMSEWMEKTFHHAALSIFVTSLTTSSAFFANAVSEITDVKCFGIFSGIAILSNFLFMVTWVPCVIVLIEKLSCKITSCECYTKSLKYISKLNLIFDKCMPIIIRETFFLWIPLLFVLSCGGIFAIFVYPKLELPQSNEFQVFLANDPLEVWDFELKQKFRYFQQSADNAQLSFGLPIFVVWGIKEEDNGNILNPEDHGVIDYDTSFHIASPKSQLWMDDFCSSFFNSTVVESTLQQIPCTFTIFKAMMTLPCVHPDLQPCCNQSDFPFSDEIFNECYPKLTHALMNVANIDSLPTHGQAIYMRDTGEIKAYMIFAIGTQAWSGKLETMDNYHNRLLDLITSKSTDAPVGIERGWISTYLRFYDMQRAISSGTYIAIGISVVIAAIVMLFTSMNLLITIFALITIMLAIGTTVGSLVLLGWELNVLESSILSLAVGLSIDFTIHYGVAYRLSTSTKRPEKVQESFHRVGSSVSMAAFTTFIAGAAMMGVKILVYTRLGVFLMMCMSCSWFYSTFFFQSLCRLLGPKYTNTLNMFNGCLRRNREKGAKNGQRTVIDNNMKEDNAYHNDLAYID